MTRTAIAKRIATVSATLALAGFALSANAQVPLQGTTYQLARLTLTNVDDAAGRWQHEGGNVMRSGVQIGKYAAHRRVTWGGTDTQNTAMLTMTIFFNGANPPVNLTLHGSHDFNSGIYIGSVGAASESQKHVIGARFTGNTATGNLTITR